MLAILRPFRSIDHLTAVRFSETWKVSYSAPFSDPGQPRSIQSMMSFSRHLTFRPSRSGWGILSSHTIRDSVRLDTRIRSQTSLRVSNLLFEDSPIMIRSILNCGASLPGRYSDPSSADVWCTDVSPRAQSRTKTNQSSRLTGVRADSGLSSSARKSVILSKYISRNSETNSSAQKGGSFVMRCIIRPSAT